MPPQQLCEKIGAQIRRSASRLLEHRGSPLIENRSGCVVVQLVRCWHRPVESDRRPRVARGRSEFKPDDGWCQIGIDRDRNGLRCSNAPSEIYFPTHNPTEVSEYRQGRGLISSSDEIDREGLYSPSAGKEIASPRDAVLEAIRNCVVRVIAESKRYIESRSGRRHSIHSLHTYVENSVINAAAEGALYVEGRIRGEARHQIHQARPFRLEPPRIEKLVPDQFGHLHHPKFSIAHVELIGRRFDENTCLHLHRIGVPDLSCRH